MLYMSIDLHMQMFTAHANTGKEDKKQLRINSEVNEISLWLGVNLHSVEEERTEREEESSPHYPSSLHFLSPLPPPCLSCNTGQPEVKDIFFPCVVPHFLSRANAQEKNYWVISQHFKFPQS